jgi:hypothetical protein
MSKRMWWIIILVAAGVGAAIVIGVLGTRNEESKTQAVTNFCASLQSLDTSIKSLTSLPSSASKSDYQAAVTAVQNDWNTVKTDAQAVQNAPTGDLDSAWDSFTSSVKNVPNDASVSDAVSDITQSADALVSAAQTTASEVNCSSSSSSTTTTTTTSG